MSDDLKYSKKDHRKLSAFLGHEMLYDYLSRTLDPERMKSMDEVVAENREIQDEIQRLNTALNYVEHLSESDVATGLLDQVKQPTSYFQGFLQKVRFQDWPHGLKLGLEVLIVTTFLALGTIFLPWQNLTKLNWGRAQEILLSEVKREFDKPIKTEDDLPGKQLAEAQAKESGFQDEATPTPTPTPQVASTPTPAPAVTVAAGVPIAPVDKMPVSTPVPKAKAVVLTENQADETSDQKRQGWLYRGAISVVNLEATSLKFVEKITELGGRKAGEVELGWKKGQGTYFHFTIPEAKYEELTAYLKQYGALKIQKDKHEKVLPDGIIRLIVSVSEAQKKSP